MTTCCWCWERVSCAGISNRDCLAGNDCGGNSRSKSATCIWKDGDSAKFHIREAIQKDDPIAVKIAGKLNNIVAIEISYGWSASNLRIRGRIMDLDLHQMGVERGPYIGSIPGSCYKDWSDDVVRWKEYYGWARIA